MFKNNKRITNIGKIFIILIICLFIWYSYFNIKLINKGRELTIDNLIDNSYESKNEKFYLEFINNNLLFYKHIDNNKTIHSLNSKYSLNDGLLVVDSYNEKYESFSMILLDNDKIYVIELNQLLYLI